MDDKITEIIIRIETALARMEQKLDNVNTTLANHENRISKLEYRPKTDGAGDDYKTELLKLLGKGIIIALLTIGSLTGASGLIQNIFNNQQTTKEISR